MEGNEKIFFFFATGNINVGTGVLWPKILQLQSQMLQYFLHFSVEVPKYSQSLWAIHTPLHFSSILLVYIFFHLLFLHCLILCRTCWLSVISALLFSSINCLFTHELSTNIIEFKYIFKTKKNHHYFKYIESLSFDHM